LTAGEFVFAPGAEDLGARADVFLTGRVGGYSRSMVQSLIADGRVSSGGKIIKSNYRIRGGEIITAELPEPAAPSMAAEDIPLDIQYEDDDVVVVNKPRGMVVHPAAGVHSGTLANALLHHCGGSLSGINGVLRPGIVHRIDRDTSGLIVAAKNDAAHASLSGQLRAHTAIRVYYALCRGNIKRDSGMIDRPLGRDPKDRKRFAVVKTGGRRAVTRFKTLERFAKYTLIEARLETGRTHQIRAHMASLGHPLYGDRAYASPPHEDDGGQALHAAVLGFTHPKTEQKMLFVAPLPDYFLRILERLHQN